MTNHKKEHRKPYLMEALFPLVAMIAILTVGYSIFGYPAEVLLILVTVVTMIIAARLGWSWDELMDEICDKIKKAAPSMLIMITVGFMVATWEASGTVPMMIYYGIQIVNPKFMLVTTFLITAIVSMCTGTSRGAAGTMGVALMGISIGLGVSLPATAGAVIAGSYFGDKLSPLSDTTILAPMTAGSELYEHIKHMLWTTVPASAVSLLVYLFAGLLTTEQNYTSSETVNEMLSTLDLMYSWNVILLLPVAIVLVGSVLKKPTIPVMIISSIVASGIAVTMQGIDIKDLFTAAMSGFDVSMINAEGFDPKNVSYAISKLVNRGGMNGMNEMMLLLYCAFVFAGIMSKTGCLETILNALLSVVKSTGGLIAVTLASCFTMSLTTGSSYLSIIIPGEMFQGAYKKRGLAAVNLSRTLEDAGTMIVPLIPWASAGVYMTVTLGVNTLEYLPWCVLNYTGVIFALIYGFTGIGIKKLSQDKAEDSES